jgi:hypothetical protein
VAVQARQGSETMVLGFVAASLALVVASVGALHLVNRFAIDLGAAPGDHVAIAGPAPGFAFDATARLPNGRACQIGLGRDAADGGDLYVVARGPDGDIDAIWSSNGRSSAAGADCGNGAEVNLDRLTFSQLAAVAHGGDPVVPMDNSVAF